MSMADSLLNAPSENLLDVVPFLNAKYGQGIGPVFLDHVYCSGNEDALDMCNSDGLGVANCPHTQDAGVRCQGTIHLCMH